MNTCYTIRWFVTIFTGLVFAASGACKLLGDPVFTSWFGAFGIPLHYMQALGVVEWIGAIALCIPSLARYANVGFLAIAIAATVMHLVFAQPVEALLPTALATATAIAVWGTPGHPVEGPEPKVLVDREPSALHWPGRFAGQQ